MDTLFSFLQQHIDLVLLYTTVLSILAFLMMIIQGYKISKLDKKYKNLTRNIEGKNIEEIINQYYEKIDHMDIRINKMDNWAEKAEERLATCIQKVGIVRYNAFDDIGGSLSFSLALLNEQHNGMILTSIYSRSGNVIYGKPVKKGKATVTLSAEELQALDRAKSNSLDEYVKMIS